MRHSLLGKVAQNKEGRRGDRRPPIRNPVCKHAYSFAALVAIAPTSNGGGNKYCTKIAVASLTPSRLPGCRRSPPRPPKFNVAAYVGGRRLVVSSTPPPRQRESILHQEGNKASNTCGPTLKFGEGGGFCVCGRHPNPTLEMRPGYKLMRHFFRPLRWATTNRLGHACRVHCAHGSARPRLSSPLCTCVVCIYIYTDVHVLPGRLPGRLGG